MKRSAWFSVLLLAEENVEEGGLATAWKFFNEQFWSADKDDFDCGYCDYLDNFKQRESENTYAYEYGLPNTTNQREQSPTSRQKHGTCAILD